MSQTQVQVATPAGLTLFTDSVMGNVADAVKSSSTLLYYLAKLTVFMMTGAGPGKIFATALSAACVTTGGTAGVTSPTNPVIVTLAYV